MWLNTKLHNVSIIMAIPKVKSTFRKIHLEDDLEVHFA